MSDTSSCHILLMDDEPALLRLMSTYLSRMGYAVESCQRGQEAWRRFASHPECYDLVIADLSMPDLEVETMLPRFVEVKSDIRVLVCSGKIFDCAMLAREIRGNFSVLQKPFVPKMLLEAVKDALARAHARVAVA